jgi:hypothetical protein
LPVNDDSDEESKNSPENNSSFEGSLIYYDALDGEIYEEIEKEINAVNSERRMTDYSKEHKRFTLPALKPKSSINIFKILKDAIGKDLSKF